METAFAIGWSVLRSGSAVLAAAWLVTAAMRRSSASARHAVWLTALFGMALLAMHAALPVDLWSPAAAFDVPVIKVLVSAGGVHSQGAGNAQWLLTAWLTVAAALLASLAESHVRVLLLARRAKTLDESTAAARFVESPLGQGPMTWGFFRPVVFLPREAGQWENGLRESVLKHELAHCERNDCWWLLIARVIASLLWFQPLAWWAVHRISAESERAADDAVLRAGVSSGDYANWLIRIARTMRGEPAAALAMGRSSEFEGRLKAVLDERVNRRRLSRTGALALAAAACVVLLPLAAAQKTEGQKTDSDEKVYKFGGDVSAPIPIKKVEPQYTEEARDAKIIGTVLLRLHIEKDGSPQNITVIEGLPMGLDEKAVEAIKQWKFKPGMKDGKPVRVQATIEVNFRLN